MIPNVNNPTALKVEYHILPHTITFTKFCSRVITDDEAETDIKQRLSKAITSYKLFGDLVSTPLEQN